MAETRNQAPEEAFAGYTRRLVEANARIWRGDVVLETSYCGSCHQPLAITVTHEPPTLIAVPPGLKAQAVPWHEHQLERLAGACPACGAGPGLRIPSNLYISRVFPLAPAVFVAALGREGSGWAPSMCYALGPGEQWTELGPMSGPREEFNAFGRSFHITEEFFAMAALLKPDTALLPVRSTAQTLLINYQGDMQRIAPAVEQLALKMGLPPKYNVGAGPSGVFPAAMDRYELSPQFHEVWDRSRCGYIFVHSLPEVEARLAQWAHALGIEIRYDGKAIEFTYGGRAQKTSLSQLSAHAGQMLLTLDDALYDLYFWEGHVLDEAKTREHRKRAIEARNAAQAAAAAPGAQPRP